jgi:hypothetical protein
MISSHSYNSMLLLLVFALLPAQISGFMFPYQIHVTSKRGLRDVSYESSTNPNRLQQQKLGYSIQRVSTLIQAANGTASSGQKEDESTAECSKVYATTFGVLSAIAWILV